MRKLSIVVLVVVVGLGAAFALAFRNLDTYLTENRDLVARGQVDYEIVELAPRDVAGSL